MIIFYPSLVTFNHFPSNTNVAGPESQISVMFFPSILKETDKFPPLVITLTGLLSICPARTEAMAEAVTPVPHERVSSSTPLSKVLT